MNGAERGADVLSDIELILRVEIGLDASTVGSSLVQRAVQRRMEKRGITDIATYAGHLSADMPELQELVEEVVVPETYFFREPDAIANVARRAIASLPHPAAASPLRVLSVPCSTGEEPYSIAMALLMAGLPRGAIAIDAIDVSHEAIGRARAGVFRSGSFRGDVGAWKNYFRQTAAGWQLDESVRTLVRVVHGNLMSDGFHPPREQYDVIFCRNLLIYFDTEAQTRALGNLAPLLAPGGVLVVGAADSFAARRAGFEPSPGSERSFLFRLQKDAGTAESELVAFTRARSRKRDLAARQASRPTTSAAPPRVAAPRRRPDAPVVAVPPETVAASPIAEVARLADEGRLADALSAGERAMRDGLASAELLALMGTTHAAVPDLVRAEDCYRRALFLDPTHEEALLHLSLLLDQRGATVLADRLRTRARRAFSFNVTATR